MNVRALSGHGMSGSEHVSGHIDDWDQQIKHHIKQQAQQVANQECDADASPLSVTVSSGSWRVKLLLIGDWDAANLFVADQWSLKQDDATVTYEVDETDPMSEIRARLDDAIVDTVAAEMPFDADMMDLRSLSWYDSRDAHFKLEL